MKNKLLAHILLQFLGLACLFLLFSCSSPKEEAADHYKNAKQYFIEEEYEKAKIEFQNVIQLEPENDQAQLDLGETYVHLQDPVKAAAAFQQAVLLNPNNLKAKLRFGQILLLAKETRKARETTNEILEKKPENVEAMHLLASIQIQERNLSQALKTLEKAIDIDEKNPKTHFFLAHLLFVMNKLEQAEPHYVRAIELDETARAPYVELAALYRNKGSFEKIEPLLTRWSRVPGDKVQKNADLAQFLESQGQTKEAEKKFLEATMNAPKDKNALVNLGSFYVRQKKNAKALEIFNRALVLDKENIDIQSKLALLAFLEKEYSKAESIVDNILENNKNHVEANLLKGRLHFVRKEFPLALKNFETVITESPNHAMARYYKARCLLDKGKSDLPGQDLFRVAAGYSSSESWERKLAKEELIEVTSINPNFIDARLLLIDILLRDKETLQARRHLVYILQRDPKNIQALVFAGQMKILGNDLNGAEKIYQTVLKLRPDFAAGYVSLGLALNGMGKTDQALEAFDKALKINPNQMDALHYKVSLFMQKKESNKAITACNRHRDNFSSDSLSLAIIDLIQGRIYMSERKIDEAEALFKKSVERNPDLSAPYEQLAIIREYKKDITGAIRYYEQLLKIKAEYLPVYLNLSRIYKSQGDIKKAKAYLEQALSVQSDFAPAANNLAFILAETKSSLYEALRLAKVARDKEPNNPDYLDTLGWIYYLQGSNDLALAALEESVELNDKNPLSQYHLGWAYYDKKEFEKARSHMKIALDLDPNFKDADKARDILGG